VKNKKLFVACTYTSDLRHVTHLQLSTYRQLPVGGSCVTACTPWYITHSHTVLRSTNCSTHEGFSSGVCQCGVAVCGVWVF
jgi:hypothetical protein